MTIDLTGKIIVRGRATPSKYFSLRLRSSMIMFSYLHNITVLCIAIHIFH